MGKYMVVRKAESCVVIEADSAEEALELAADMPTHEFVHRVSDYWDEIDPDYGDAVGGSYEVVRFRSDGTQEVIKTGVSLKDAQEWCSRDDTRGEGWFDGYREEV